MPGCNDDAGDDRCDVLVVGSGPTGLALAAQLTRFGVTCRIVDRNRDRAHESRALAVQARTLEVLRPLDIADELIRQGNPAARLRLHAGRKVTSIPLFDIGMDDTRYPFLLFLSQARVEAILAEHLSRRGLVVERETEFTGFGGVDADRSELACLLRTPGGREAVVRARYVVGCDGAHSTVRKATHTTFAGARYPQTFLLADLAVDGLDPDSVHAYLTAAGPLLFFPLEEPAPWRMVTLRPRTPSRTADSARPAVDEREPTTIGAVSLEELQELCRSATTEPLGLHEPVWATAFSVHHRQAGTYRRGNVFLAGDAAHIHSPVGAQGMNTGIQDAINLGWKLGLVLRDRAPVTLLDTYDAERRPVGAFVLRFTDRGFAAATSTTTLANVTRAHLVPRILPLVLRVRRGRAAAFRTLSQLDVRYRAGPAVDDLAGEEEGDRKSRPWPQRRRLPGPRAGDRLPDARIRVGGQERWVQDLMADPAFHLLLIGDGWDEVTLDGLRRTFGHRLVVHRLAAQPFQVRTGVLGRLSRAAGGGEPVQLVVRPDGHVGCRADGTDLKRIEPYLFRWLTPSDQPSGRAEP